MTAALYKGENIYRWVAAAATRRVDVWSIGNSNEILNATGWNSGLILGIRDQWNMYATGLTSPRENESNGAGNGEGWVYGGSSYLANHSAPPAPFDQYQLGIGPQTGSYFVASPTPARGGAIRLFPEAWANNDTHPPANGVRFHARIGTFAANPGTYYEFARRDSPPWNILRNVGPISVTGAADGLEWIQFDVDTSAHADQNIICGLGQTNQTNGSGNFFNLWMQCEAHGQQTGVCYSTVGYLGGRSLREHVERWQALTATNIREMIESTVRLQNGEPMLLIRVAEGLNSRNDMANSAGPNPAPANTQAGYYDDLVAFRNVIQPQWESLGYKPENLFWMSVPDHPVEDDDSTLTFARYASIRFADDYGAAFYDSNVATSRQEIADNGWYLGGGSTNPHLEAAGYAALGRREVADWAAAATEFTNETVATAVWSHTPRTLTDGAITASTYDQSTAYPLASDSAGLATQANQDTIIAKLSGSTIPVVGAVSNDGTITVFQNEGRVVPMSVPGVDLTGATLRLVAYSSSAFNESTTLFSIDAVTGGNGLANVTFTSIETGTPRRAHYVLWRNPEQAGGGDVMACGALNIVVAPTNHTM